MRSDIGPGLALESPASIRIAKDRWECYIMQMRSLNLANIALHWQHIKILLKSDFFECHIMVWRKGIL